jgi:uncharacterized surface protein with fasciclin (FAS1) repeats
MKLQRHSYLIRRTVGLAAIVAAGVVALPLSAETRPGASVIDAQPSIAAPKPASESPAGTVATPGDSAAPAAAPTASPTAAAGTIVEVASGSETFKTLVAALTEAELTETLSATGPFTVFAPTDAAFAALPDGTVEMLLKPENRAKLVKILTYHVVPGAITSDKIAAGDVNTVEGSPVTLTVADGKVTVGGANVTQADIEASNGVIHAIDKVIMPPGL